MFIAVAKWLMTWLIPRSKSVLALLLMCLSWTLTVAAESPAAVRATISFPPEVYETLEVIAKQKKVSLAWVVREAAEQYLAEKWPLFARQGEGAQHE